MHKKILFITLINISMILFAQYSIAMDESGQQKNSPEIIELSPNYETESEIVLGAPILNFKTFRISIPENTFALKIQIQKAPADLDLFIKYGDEIRNYNESDFSLASDLFNEEIFISRVSDTALQTGIYYIDVAYQRKGYPIVDGRIIKSIPFVIKAELFKQRTDGVLKEDIRADYSINIDEGLFKTFIVDVPQGAEALRVDLFNAYNDLDIFLGYDSPVVSRESAYYIGDSLLAKESIVLTDTTPIPLRPGRYYITVVDQLADENQEKFSIISSFKKEAPEFLTRLPELYAQDDGLLNCLRATVEIVINSGKGSGCIVSQEGHILTNLHVITDFSGQISNKIFVSLNLSEELPPEELFQAKLIAFDKKKDLAILKIYQGLYGQELPGDYVFPYYTISGTNEQTIGQPIGLIGYPSVGSSGSRTSISYTKGIISGFEKTEYGLIFKTDGEISSGSSGGGVIDSYYELIGIPSAIVEEESSKIGFISPAALVPEEWMYIINPKPFSF